MTKFDPYMVLERLSNSADKITLKRKIHAYRINFRDSKSALYYLDRLDRLSRIRR